MKEMKSYCKLSKKQKTKTKKTVTYEENNNLNVMALRSITSILLQGRNHSVCHTPVNYMFSENILR